MAWIESHQSLAHHPKTRKLARRLDISIAAAVGHLHCLWHWSLEHAFDGDLTGYESEDIAIGAMWDGDPDDFVKALIESRGRSGSGFLDHDNERLTLHNWQTYTAHLRARRESAQKANHQRWHVARGVNDGECEWCRNPAPEESESPPKQPDSERSPNGRLPESTEPNLTEPNLTLPTQPNLESERKPVARARNIQQAKWKPTDALIDWAVGERPDLDIATELDKFYDHFRGTGKPMKDWDAAWRNWIRRSAQFTPAGRQR